MANRVVYGFRPITDGDPNALIEHHPVASAYQATVGGNVDLNIGDPVALASGNVQLVDGTEGTPGRVYGIIASIGPYLTGGVMRPTDVLPGGTTWTNFKDRSTVGIIPASKCRWRITSVQGSTSYDTETEYYTAVGKNVDHILQDSGNNKADPALDLNPIATTTAQWRIVGVEDLVGQDYSLSGVELIVVPNETAEAPFYTTGT